MKNLFILIMLFYSCSSKHSNENIGETATNIKTAKTENVYLSREARNDTNIVNTSGHKTYILYNSIDNFLEKTDTAGVHFSTECMICEQMKPYQGHLIFADVLEIFLNKASYRETPLLLADTIKWLNRIGSYENSKTVRFAFSNGKGKIKHLGQSCNDAYFKQVVLEYSSGDVRINNVLNAQFFEFDLDKDGRPEQFIIASRNCSQELAVIRIV